MEASPIEQVEEGSEFDPFEEIDIVIEEDEADIGTQELLNSSGVPPIIRIVNAVNHGGPAIQGQRYTYRTKGKISQSCGTVSTECCTARSKSPLTFIQLSFQE